MKHMLKWVADNASMMIGPKAEYGSDLALTAAHDIKRFLAAGRNLSLDRVDVEDRVADRNHATGIKSFDALLKKNQGTFITGNVYGDAQFSTFVRPYTEVHCNGQESNPGELRKFDLNAFSNHGFREFESINRWLHAHPEQSTIVYALRNKIADYNESGQKNNPNWHCYGYLITDEKHNLLYRHDNTFSNRKVLDEAIHFLTNSRHENVTPWAKVKDGEVEIFSPEVQEAYDKLVAKDLMLQSQRKEINLPQLYDLWDKFSDIPVDSNDAIEEEFIEFKVGTPREDIWRWFESKNSSFIVGDVQSGKRNVDSPAERG